MKHYGIFHNPSNQWMKFVSGEVFWTTSLPVAEAQLASMTIFSQNEATQFEIKEFA